MDILDLKKLAMEQHGLSEEEAGYMIEGFVKEAALGDKIDAGRLSQPAGGSLPELNYRSIATHTWDDKNMAGEFATNVAKSLGGGVGSLLLNGAVTGGMKLFNTASHTHEYYKFTQALKRVIETNRLVKNADREKVMSYADTLFKFGPHVASDANLLSQLLSNAIHGEGIDPNTIETVTRLEERYTGKRGFQPKNFT